VKANGGLAPVVLRGLVSGYFQITDWHVMFWGPWFKYRMQPSFSTIFAKQLVQLVYGFCTFSLAFCCLFSVR